MTARASEAYRRAVRTGGDCIHGQLGGDIVRPWTGTPACALCRRRRPIHWRTIGEPAKPQPLPDNVIPYRRPGALF